MEKMVYSIQEVAELLGISRSYAYELVRKERQIRDQMRRAAGMWLFFSWKGVFENGKKKQWRGNDF